MRAMPRPRQDYTHHVSKHGSPAVRVALLAAGTLCVIMGIAGLFLPVLPTTPFLIAAAACFARASERFYNALLNNRIFGPIIIEWQEHRSIPMRTKITAIVLMALTLSVSIIFFVEPGWLQASLAVFGLFLAYYIYRIPTRSMEN